jgi:ribosomal-protein-alanine N-acetyltransferase
VVALDQSCFGLSWPQLEANEMLWTLDEGAAARWAIIPGCGEAELLRIAVHPEARRSGQGREILRASTEALRAEGISVFHLEVRASNTPARTLYESEGWRCTGIRKAYYKDGEDAVVYRKDG